MTGMGGSGRRVTVAVLAALAVGVLAACTTGGGSGMCRDWILTSGPEDWDDGATLIVEADVITGGRTVDITGVYVVHETSPTPVITGERPDGTIDVISPSVDCTTAGEPVTYDGADPLAEDGRYRLYLRPEEGRHDVWRLVVPGAVEPLAD
ncbi:hypothetical protein [Clavibacter phaseoli]|uniref:hypothetical protein n=1 Tax=Clavibacter phaseoli TaxID=1734031 RepID=UPI000E662F4A|nr:hypothetical protein [Clavibacter phaseoli]UKF30132.1 hypothetical protein FGD69_03275 [Clavibacter phaseoli]UKF36050.1 hypothetical protein FGI33_02655 [Clavibacter phaseoli]